MSQKYNQKYHVGNPTETFEFELDPCENFSFPGIAKKAANDYNKKHKNIEGWLSPITLTLLEIPGGQRSFEIKPKSIVVFEVEQIQNKKI